AGVSAKSKEVSAVPGVKAGAPAAPELTVTGEPNAAKLQWTKPSEGSSPITGYIIYPGSATGGEVVYTEAGASVNTYVDTPVTNGTRYFDNVAAVDAVGAGALSSEQAAIPGAAPGAP